MLTAPDYFSACVKLAGYARLSEHMVAENRSFTLESAIDNRPPSNIGRACVTTKEVKRKIITASER